MSRMAQFHDVLLGVKKLRTVQVKNARLAGDPALDGAGWCIRVDALLGYPFRHDLLAFALGCHNRLCASVHHHNLNDEVLRMIAGIYIAQWHQDVEEYIETLDTSA